MFLAKLSLLRIPHLNNALFDSLSKYCHHLKTLEIGGHPTSYNHFYSLEGISQLCQSKFVLENVRFEYCSKIGDSCIHLIAHKSKEALTEFHIIRNCFEKSAKISDKSIEHFRYCPNMTRLSIVYTRKFKEMFHVYLARYLHKLVYLNIKECTV